MCGLFRHEIVCEFPVIVAEQSDFHKYKGKRMKFLYISKIHIVFNRIYKIIQRFPLFSLEIACASVYFADFHKIVRNLLQIYIYI